MVLRAIAASVAATTVLVLGGCTSSGSGEQHVAPASSGRTTAGSPSSAPTSSAATCSPGTTRLTYHRHLVITSGEQFELPPDSKLTTPKRLPVVQEVRAAAPGLGTGSGLTGSVSKHWHTRAYPLGTSSRTVEATSTTTLSNHSSRNVSDAVFRLTHVFTGSFTSSCGGAAVRGRYRTFGPVDDVIVGCGDKIRGRLDRIGHRQFCQ